VVSDQVSKARRAAATAASTSAAEPRAITPARSSGRGVDHIMRPAGLARIGPGPVDVEFQVLAHTPSLSAQRAEGRVSEARSEAGREMAASTSPSSRTASMSTLARDAGAKSAMKRPAVAAEMAMAASVRVGGALGWNAAQTPSA
jgi:hypothetical protein